MGSNPTLTASFNAELAAAKAVGWRYLRAPLKAEVLETFLEPDCQWHAGHPHNLLNGRAAICEHFWRPLLDSFPDLERRADIFLGGYWDGHLDGGEGFWVSATGHYVGTFRSDWLDIPATDEPATIRFGEFYRIVDGLIVETRVLLDLPSLMRQAGLLVLPPSPGLDILVPGPGTHEGLLTLPQDSAESAASMDLVMAMIGGLGRYNQGDMRSMSLEDYWHPNMMWYGPSGIGTTRGIGGFQRHHQQPFLHAFPDRKGGNHRARLAEGNYIASTGWPSVRATHLGEYLGIPATGVAIQMRVMDWWRREDNLLVENWVFIDFPHLFLQMGVDLFSHGLRSCLGQRQPE